MTVESLIRILYQKNIINSKISKLFNLENINWTEIDINASDDVLKQFCNMWNSGIHDLNEIGFVVGYKPNSLYSYLKKARKLSLIQYDKEESEKRRLEKCKAVKYKEFVPIMCVDNGYVFNSLKTCEDLSDKLFGKHLLNSCLCNVCKGKSKTTGGFHFEYITQHQFNEIKSMTPDKAFGDFFIESVM